MYGSARVLVSCTIVMQAIVAFLTNFSPLYIGPDMLVELVSSDPVNSSRAYIMQFGEFLVRKIRV